MSLGRVTIFSIVASAFFFGIFIIAAWTVDDAIRYTPTLNVGAFETQGVQATAFIVFDQESGTEIASHNSSQVLPIASVTKLATAAMFYESANLDATTTITWPDVNTDGDAGRLKPFEVYSYRELMYPLLLESSNDAAATIMRVHPTLLKEMETYTHTLGLSQTVFVDPSGLSDQNVSTAYELFILSNALYKAYPHIFDILHIKQFIGSNTGWMNNNPFVLEEGYVSGKHGFTYAANRTAVVFFNETLQSGHVRTFGYVVLGSPNLKADIAVLREEVKEKVNYQ